MVLTYKKSGVDIHKKDRFVEGLLEKIYKFSKEKTLYITWVFAGCYKYKNLLICGACDGVGTKIRIAELLNNYKCIGEDVVAMNVNDLVVHNIKPLFFLDYISFNKLDKKKGERVLEGIMEGCKKAGTVLLGGETAIMPSFYTKNSFEVVGCAIGITTKNNIIYGKFIKQGDIIIGLKSSGVHSNGFSLVRKVIFKNGEDKNILARKKIDNTSLGEILLTPTKIYVKTFLKITTKFKPNRIIKGAAHITGGGIPGNLSRIIPDGLSAVINTRLWEKPAIFEYIQKEGKISTGEMYRTFNMGIGFIIVVDKKYFSKVKSFLEKYIDEKFYVIGEIEKGIKKVRIIY